MYGQRLKELRESSGLTQKELAKIMHVSQQDISRYELEQIQPSIEFIVQFCRRFSVSSDYLLGVKEY